MDEWVSVFGLDVPAAYLTALLLLRQILTPRVEGGSMLPNLSMRCFSEISLGWSVMLRGDWTRAEPTRTL